MSKTIAPVLSGTDRWQPAGRFAKYSGNRTDGISVVDGVPPSHGS